MSTDLYGIRVLERESAAGRVRLRVFVVYYDTHYRYHQPLPDDPSFFLRALWNHADAHGDAPLTAAISPEEIYDEVWVDANAWRFVSGVHRLDTANHPLAEPDWADLHDFYHQRDGGWADEDRLVRADYDVRVTDPGYLHPLVEGMAFGTTAYPTVADRVRVDDLPHLPDLDTPLAVLAPFEGPGTEDSTPDALVFSDDGRYLAVTSAAGALVVYTTDGWTEQARVAPAEQLLFPLLKWLPDRHVLAVWSPYKPELRYGYDVTAGVPVEPGPQRGQVRSITGGYRVEFGLPPFEEPLPDERGAGLVPIGDVPEGSVNGAAFTRDGSRLFVVGSGPEVSILETPSGAAVGTIRTAAEVRVHAVAADPGGAYVAVSYPDADTARVAVLRVADGVTVSRRTPGPYPCALSWSPDGRFLAASVVTGDDGFGGELRVFPVGRTAPVTPTSPGRS